jgi:hypothetical protein
VSAADRGRRPRALRRRYANEEYPLVLLRFEDGHEIRVARGSGRTFDAYAGERIHIIAIYDPTSDERVLVETRRAEDFPE